mmetsp:Transcript_28532/g.25196  ORF Transcript_28532/g.25196 Transcript_28532/m.25196 type:complete len:150 (+) Transcript_28532:112-561(+)
MAMSNISRARKRLNMIKQQLSRPSHPLPSKPEPCNDINNNDIVQGNRILIHHNFGVIIDSFTYLSTTHQQQSSLMAYGHNYKTDKDKNDNLKHDINLSKVSSDYYPTPKPYEQDKDKEKEIIQSQPEGTPEGKEWTINEGITTPIYKEL